MIRSNAMTLPQLLRRVHRDERGAVTLETVLIIAAIALPILIFLLKYGWPKIKNYFNSGMRDMENEADRVKQGG
jgi:Flp pilus assembly pilin Flp